MINLGKFADVTDSEMSVRIRPTPRHRDEERHGNKNVDEQEKEKEIGCIALHTIQIKLACQHIKLPKEKMHIYAKLSVRSLHCVIFD